MDSSPSPQLGSDQPSLPSLPDSPHSPPLHPDSSLDPPPPVPPPTSPDLDPSPSCNGSLQFDQPEECASIDSPADAAACASSEDRALLGVEERIAHSCAPDAPAAQNSAGTAENETQEFEINQASVALVDTLERETSVSVTPDPGVPGNSASGLLNGADRGAGGNDSGCGIGVETSDSGWTNGVQSSGEGVASGWIDAHNHIDAVAPELPPERVVPISRRRTFFLVRMPRIGDSLLRNKIKLAELQLEEACKNRDFVRAALQLKRASKMGLLDKLKIARDKERVCKEATQKKRMEIEPLQGALNKFKLAHSTSREDLCSSEEELNDRIAYLQHRIQHESIPLREEKQLVREIKQLESTRSQICANVAAQAVLIENLGPKEDIQEHCSILYQELDTLRHEQFQARAECEPVEKDLEKLNVIMDDLVKQLEIAKRAQQEAFVDCKELKRLQGEQNFEFYKNKEDIRKAKELASKKNLEELEAFCLEQVEGILNRWNKDASFREKYAKNNEQSTLRRLETLDGRSLGPDEEPFFQMNDLDIMPDSMVKGKETSSEMGAQTKIPATAGHMEGFKKTIDEAKQLPKVVKAAPSKTLGEANAVSDSKESEEKIVETLKVSKSAPSTVPASKSNSLHLEDETLKETQAAELKEKRRQEEMAKAREAAERKKRQAERAQAKALLRAQREAEHREKEREKKARKKAAANIVDSDSVEVSSQSEAREIAVAPQELPQDSSDAVKGSSSQRKKVGRKQKMARPSVIGPLPKKKMWPFPTWVWVVIAVILLSFFLTLLITS